MNIRETIAQVSHRPYPMPRGQWYFCQQWRNVLMIHRQVPLEEIEDLVPKRLPIDSFDGFCYVSLVLFSVAKSRPFFLPSFPPVSDFHEVNVRTYVTRDGRPGIYFLSVEASKSFVAKMLRILTFLPYEKATVRRSPLRFDTKNHKEKYSADIAYTVDDELLPKDPLDIWLTERYALYLDHKQDFFRYDIHHKPWPLRRLSIQESAIDYHIRRLDFGDVRFQKLHFADRLDVVAWEKSKLA